MGGLGNEITPDQDEHFILGGHASANRARIARATRAECIIALAKFPGIGAAEASHSGIETRPAVPALEGNHQVEVFRSRR